MLGIHIVIGQRNVGVRMSLGKVLIDTLYGGAYRSTVGTLVCTFDKKKPLYNRNRSSYGGIGGWDPKLCTDHIYNLAGDLRDYVCYEGGQKGSQRP